MLFLGRCEHAIFMPDIKEAVRPTRVSSCRCCTQPVPLSVTTGTKCRNRISSERRFSLKQIPWFQVFISVPSTSWSKLLSRFLSLKEPLLEFWCEAISNGGAMKHFNFNLVNFSASSEQTHFCTQKGRESKVSFAFFRQWANWCWWRSWLTPTIQLAYSVQLCWTMGLLHEGRGQTVVSMVISYFVSIENKATSFWWIFSLTIVQNVAWFFTANRGQLASNDLYQCSECRPDLTTGFTMDSLDIRLSRPQVWR